MEPRETPKPLSTTANTIWNASGCLFYLGCQWLTTVLVVVLSDGYSNSGLLAYAMSVGNMFAAFALYKIRTYQVSDVDNLYSGSNYIGFRIFTVLTGYVAFTIYLVFITNDIATIVATLLYLVFRCDDVFTDVVYGIEQRGGRMDYIGKSQFIRGVAVIVGFSVPLKLTGNLLAAVGGMSVLCIINTVLFDVSHARRFGAVKASITRAQIVSLLKACLLPTIANVLANSIVSIARQSYGNMNGSEYLGIYASIATPAVLIQAGVLYLYSPMIGSLATTLHDKGMPAFKVFFLKVLALLMACVAVIVVSLSFFGVPLLSTVYGESIRPYTWIFPYALATTASIALLLYVNDVLIVLRDGITQIVINLIGVFVVIVLSHAFFELWDMNGINLIVIAACIPSALIGIFVILLKKARG